MSVERVEVRTWRECRLALGRIGLGELVIAKALVRCREHGVSPADAYEAILEVLEEKLEEHVRDRERELLEGTPLGDEPPVGLLNSTRGRC